MIKYVIKEILFTIDGVLLVISYSIAEFIYGALRLIKKLVGYGE